METPKPLVSRYWRHPRVPARRSGVWVVAVDPSWKEHLARHLHRPDGTVILWKFYTAIDDPPGHQHSLAATGSRF